MTGRDWTGGRATISYQSCPRCAAIWYFRRSFCPRCGTTDPDTLLASGRGRLYAVTTVNRAPSPELRTRAPYRVALIDADEGFRLMAHVDDAAAIGDRVTARFVAFGAHTVPFFDRDGAGT